MDQVIKITAQTKTTADGLAACFGLTRPRIVQLANEGVLCRDEKSKYNLAENIYRFINSRSGSDDLSFDSERTRHERLKSRLTELKLAKIENRMHDARDVEIVMTEMLTNMRTKLLGLPATLAAQLVDMPEEKIYETINRAIEETLMELSDYNPELFHGENNELEDD